MLEGMTPPERKPTCKIRHLTETLEPGDSKIFADAINNTELWPTNTLANALRARGITCTKETIRTHRNKGCSCWRN